MNSFMASMFCLLEGSSSMLVSSTADILAAVTNGGSIIFMVPYVDRHSVRVARMCDIVGAGGFAVIGFMAYRGPLQGEKVCF